MFRAAIHLGFGLALLGVTAGVARASDLESIPSADELSDRGPSLGSAGPEAAFVVTMDFADLSSPLRVANAAWAAGVLVVALADSLKMPVTTHVGALELRPLVASDADLSVGVGVSGRF